MDLQRLKHPLFLAWAVLRVNWARSLILVLASSLIAGLPLGVNRLLDASEGDLLRRARATPVVLGRPGGNLDLVVGTLYFQSRPEHPLSQAVLDQIRATGLGRPIPVNLGFRARGTAVVGTTLDYFRFRRLDFAEGGAFALLGDAVLGARAAQRLGLKPGDTLVSQPGDLFDLASSSQIRLKVVGILRAAGTADDEAIFTDLRTTWVMAGLGHGHRSLSGGGNADVILERSEEQITANARLPLVAEVSEASLERFHFHGDPQRFPISALVVETAERQAANRLLGRYASEQGAEVVALAPIRTVERLLLTTFRLRRVFNAVSVVVAAASLLLLVLLFGLSLRMRRGEFRTCQRLGARRSTLIAMVAAEVLLLLGFAAIATAVLSQATVLLRPVVTDTLVGRSDGEN